MSAAGSRSTNAIGRSDDTTTGTAGAAVSWRSVALPSEHGGWSLTAEPALLGLIVAWSRPGLALGIAAMVAFVARTPIKLLLVDRWRHRWLDRTRLAARIATAELMVFVCLIGYVTVTAGGTGYWVPLAFAGPLVALELWYDMRSRGRRLIPELAGSIGIGSIATAIALAGDAPARVAWGLWVVIAARSLAAIPYVRHQILRTKSKPGPRWHSDVAQVAAIALAAAAWQADFVPAAAAVVLALLGLLNVVGVRIAPRRAVVIGIQQTIAGIAVVATTATAVLAA